MLDSNTLKQGSYGSFLDLQDIDSIVNGSGYRDITTKIIEDFLKFKSENGDFGYLSIWKNVLVDWDGNFICSKINEFRKKRISLIEKKNGSFDFRYYLKVFFGDKLSGDSNFNRLVGLLVNVFRDKKYRDYIAEKHKDSLASYEANMDEYKQRLHNSLVQQESYVLEEKKRKIKLLGVETIKEMIRLKIEKQYQKNIDYSIQKFSKYVEKYLKNRSPENKDIQYIKNSISMQSSAFNYIKYDLGLLSNEIDSVLIEDLLVLYSSLREKQIEKEIKIDEEKKKQFEMF